MKDQNDCKSITLTQIESLRNKLAIKFDVLTPISVRTAEKKSGDARCSSCSSLGLSVD